MGWGWGLGWVGGGVFRVLSKAGFSPLTLTIKKGSNAVTRYPYLCTGFSFSTEMHQFGYRLKDVENLKVHGGQGYGWGGGRWLNYQLSLFFTVCFNLIACSYKHCM